MTTRKRELADALLEVAELYPGWRMGQLVANVAGWAGEKEPANAWDVSDEQLLAAARAHIARRPAPVSGSSR